MFFVAKCAGLIVLCLTLSASGAEPSVTDVFVPASDGFASIRIPSVVATTHGSLVAFAEGRRSDSDQAENKIITKRSTDGGRTWGSVQLLAGDGVNSLNNPTAVVDQTTGRIFLMYQRIPAHTAESSKNIATGLDGPLIYRNFLLTSDDDGKTWAQPIDVTRSTKHPTGDDHHRERTGDRHSVTRGPHKGRLIFPFNEGPYYRWNNFAVFSDDDGATWAVGENAPGNMLGEHSQVNEVQMVELEDGSVMLNSRQFAGPKCRKTAISHDGGMTWLNNRRCSGTARSFVHGIRPSIFIQQRRPSRRNNLQRARLQQTKQWHDPPQRR